MSTKLDQRFFDSSRGRIVTLLRGTSKTVKELAKELKLTDNAVRAHLLSLERDGLIRQRGIQRGTRKPHFAYELTDEAEHLFPKAYDALLNQLISALKGRLKPEALEEVLREVGRSMAGRASSARGRAGFESRLAAALNSIEALGGSARVQNKDGQLVIKSSSCPLATAVAKHPEVCKVTEALLAEAIGEKVRERCERQGSPQCSFEVLKK